MAVKFPLEMSNGTQVRNISELKENFDVEKVVGYFLDGKLKKWLDARWYEEEAEAVENLKADDPELAEKLCKIFGIEYHKEVEINPEEIAERNARIAKIKQYTDDEEIIKNVDLVAFNQEELAELYDKGEQKIYLCEGEFVVPKSKKDLDYKMIGKVKVDGLFGEEKYGEVMRENLMNDTKCFPTEIADLVRRKLYIELNDYIVWTEYSQMSDSEKLYYKNFLKDKKAKDMTKRFKVWDKKKNEYFSFDIPSIMLPRLAPEIVAYKNMILSYDLMGNKFFYDVENSKIEKCNERNIRIGESLCVLDGEKYVYQDEDQNYKYTLFDLEKKTKKYTYINGEHEFLIRDNMFFYVKENKIFIYDVKEDIVRELYQFDRSEDYFGIRMVYYDDELFVFYGSYTKKLIGIKLNGTVREYFKKANARTMFLLYDNKVQKKSQYLVFEDDRNIYVFDMKNKKMEFHNDCTTITFTHVVEDYLYIRSISSLKVCRVDLKENWNPIQIKEV